MHTEQLFSYGTLQYEAVQLSTFGRKLNGAADTLIGYALSNLTITDPKVLATSGTATHPVLMYTGNENDEVQGVIFEISPEELAAADRYEVADYKRVAAQFRSGKTAWVYVGVNSKEN